MPQVIDGSKKNFNTTVVGDTVTVITQYNVRTEFSKQYYPNSRVYEFGNRPVWGENILSFFTPLIVAYSTTRLLTSSTIITLNNSYNYRRIQTPLEVYGYSTSTKLFTTGTNSISIPVNRDGAGVGTVAVVPDPNYLNANIYGTALITTATYAFAIEQLASTQTAGLTFGTIISANTNSGSFGSFGNGTVYVYTVTNSTSIIAISNTATIAPTNGSIDGITPTGGTYTPPVVAPLVADFLVVGGGGSGGNHNTTNANGGGGGGGVLYGTGLTLSGIYDVIVGAGGVAIANSTAANGNKGGNSSFGIYIAQGGGGGGSTGVGFESAKMNGGSGGGAAYQNGGGSATQTTLGIATGYGNNGGTSAATWTGAGGGGAGGAGVNGSGSAPGGDGGRGRAYDISGTWQWYAGGGGGGGNSSERAGDGYAGGGRGAGTTTYYNYNVYPAQGTVNSVTTGSGTPNAIPGTGGGGGGGSYWAANGGWSSGSGAGGSGIVIVRYLGSQRASGGTVTSANGYTIHTFTATGVTHTLTAGAVTSLPTFRAPLIGPWNFTITGISSTLELPSKSVISVLERSASLGTGNVVYVTNTGTSSITVSAFGGSRAPVAGTLNAIYATGEIIPDTTIASVTATSTTSWTFNILGIKGTGYLSVAAVITATSVTGSFGLGNTVLVRSIVDNTQITCYVTGTTTPIAGTIVGPYLTGITGSLPAQPGDATYVTTGTYSWTAPAGVTSVSVVAVGGGGGGGFQWSSGGGGGGGLGWKNNIPVTPGQSYTVVVGAGGESTANATNNSTNLGGTSYFISTATVAGYGGGQGGPGSTGATGGYGGGFFGDGGGRGGNGAYDGSWHSGGAGAGGYAGRGADTIGNAVASIGINGTAAPTGGGGGAGGYYSSTFGVPAGGGVGIFGQGSSGSAVGNQFFGGLGGSGGQQGRGGEGSGQSGFKTINGGAYGGGGGGSGTSYGGGWGGGGAVRIIWGTGRAFPTSNVTEIAAGPAAVVVVPFTKSSTIGGPTFDRRSPGINNSAKLFQQNHIPAISQSVVNDTRRLTLEKAKIFRTDGYLNVNNFVITNGASNLPKVSSGTVVTKFITSSSSSTSITTQVNSSINPSTTGTYVYRSTAITSSTWIFRIYNIPSATVSSLTTGTIITANTSSGQTGSFGVGSTVTVYTVVSATSIVAIAYGAIGSSAPTQGLINSIGVPGGTYIAATIPNYTAHIFTTVGDQTFTPSFTGPVEYLVVAGGGGAADTGAGGAGGYRSSVVGESSGGGASAESMLNVTAGTPYTVTVGAGGAGQTNNSSTPGGNGGNSVFGSITALGGGGGGAGFANSSASNGAVGGSGGGGSTRAGTGIQRVGGAGTAGQGYAGGASETNNWTGGGGGGAGGVGGNASGNNTPDSANTAGNGGAGVQSSISGTAMYYAGGGGGGGGNINAGLGGLGGGGVGEAFNQRAPASGAPNTGGGGGGGWENPTQGSGGSGVVIVRYLGSQNATGGNAIVTYPSQSTSPENQYQALFNGSNQYLTTPTAPFAFGANNFTVEAWVYLNALPTSDAWPTSYSSHMMLATVGTVNAGDGIGFIIGQTKLLIHNNDTQYAGTAHGMSINTWYHLAYVRNGNSIYFYVNGTAKGSAAFSGSVGTGASGWIGAETGQGAFLNGRISNLRIVKNRAVYTSDFSTPTIQPANITDTALLICRTPEFVDLSSNAVTITPVNSPVISVGSLSLRAAGSSIPTPLENQFYGLQSAFVSKVAVYSSTITDYHVGTLTNITSLTGDFGPGLITSVSGTGPWTLTIQQLRSTQQFTTGTLIHATPLGGSFGIGNIVTVSAVNSGTAVTCIARNGTVAPTTGTIVGVYSRGLDPGTYIGPVTASYTLTNTSSYSVLFNVSRLSYLQYPHSTAYNIGTAGTMWTAECWVRPEGDYTQYNTIFTKRVTGSGTTAYQGFLRIGSGVISFFNGTEYNSTYILTPNVWSHCAWVYNGSVLNIYVNGVSVYTITISLGADNTEPLLIGAARGYSEYFSGYISNFRMVKGVSVYTGTFTPPNAPLQTTQSAGTNISPISTGTYTVLLSCQSSGFTDRSVYNTGTTVSGTPTISFVNPFGFTPVAIAPWTFTINGLTSTNAFVNGSIITATAGTGNLGTGTVYVYSVNNSEQITCQSTSTATSGTINNVVTATGNYYTLNAGTPTAQYQVAFNGSNQFLRVPSTGAGFSSITTFTYECWIYPTSSLGTNCIFDISECQPFRFVLSSTGVNWQATSSGGTILTANFTWVIGTWYHVAFVRDNSNNISIFINGTRYATTTYGGNWGATASGGVNIGCNRGDTWFFPGYISNARFVKGTAIYTGNFSTPTNELTNITNTSLLICKSSTFIDLSSSALTVTPFNSPVISVGTLLLSPGSDTGPAPNYAIATSATVFNSAFGTKLGPAATVLTTYASSPETPLITQRFNPLSSDNGYDAMLVTVTSNSPYAEGNLVGNQVTEPYPVYTRDSTVAYGKTRWVIPEYQGFLYGGQQAITVSTNASGPIGNYIRTADNAKIITTSTRPTFSTSISIGVDSGAVGTIGTVIGSGPWIFDITGLSSTVGFAPKDILSAQARVGNLGQGNIVYITVVNTSSYSISCLAYGGVAPTPGAINSIYSTGELELDPSISSISTVTTASWSFTVVGLKGTSNYTAGSIVTITTSSVSGGNGGDGNTVVVSSINSINQITCYSTGTSTPRLGVISGVVPTGGTGFYPTAGDATYVTTGTYSWTAPAGVTSVSVVAVGGGGGGGFTWSSGGGGGGGLGWKNNIPVTPGQSYTVVVGQGGPSNSNANAAGSEGGNSYFISLTTVAGYGGGRGGPTSTAATNGYGGGFFGDGGGRGGNGAFDGNWQRGGAGAGGYSGQGAEGVAASGVAAPVGSGAGAAGGHYSSTFGVPAGGGVGLLGRGADGVARGQFLGGGGGSGGANGVGGEASGESGLRIINGGAFGGGGGGSGTSYGGGWGGGGAVRIIWGANRAFPTTNAGSSTVVIAVATATVKSSTIGGSSFNRESLHVYTNGMQYPESIGIDRVDQIVTVDTITDDAVQLKIYAFQNLSAATAGSKSITNSLTGSTDFYVAGTGTDGATSLSAYWS